MTSRFIFVSFIFQKLQNSSSRLYDDLPTEILVRKSERNSEEDRGNNIWFGEMTWKGGARQTSVRSNNQMIAINGKMENSTSYGSYQWLN